MLFTKTLFLTAAYLISAANSKITVWDCSSGPVAYPNPSYCRQVYRCNEAGKTDGWQQCNSMVGFIGMYSPTRRACVYTAFPDCATMQKYCPTLPTPLEIDVQPNSGADFARKHSGNPQKIKKKNIKKSNSSGLIGPKRPIPKRNLYFLNSSDEKNTTKNVERLGFVSDIGSNISNAISKITKYEPMPSNDILPWGDCSVWSDGLYSSNNCRYFMVCCGGHSQIMKCPFGTLFDDIRSRCIEARKAVCYSIRN